MFGSRAWFFWQMAIIYCALGATLHKATPRPGFTFIAVAGKTAVACMECARQGQLTPWQLMPYLVWCILPLSIFVGDGRSIWWQGWEKGMTAGQGVKLECPTRRL